MEDTTRSAWPERWDLLLRYRLIEIIALWEGRLTTNHLTRAFGIGRQQASKDINTYLGKTGGNLVYDKNLKGYKPGPDFRPRFTRGVADEYLQLLAAQNDLAESIGELNVRLPNTEVIAPPARLIRPLVLQRVVRACREKLRLEIVYGSMANPEPETRVIQPHTLVYNGYRWHVRAWCEKNRDFRDFVLTRIYDEPDWLTEQTMPVEADEAWNTRVDIEVVADSRLTPAQQRLVAEDWGFEHGVLRIPTRAALVAYSLQLFRLAPGMRDATELEQPLHVRNLEQLQRWVF
ncbi:MAG: hypothetical protein K0Q68_337 [Moraxellaceae bacterium]|nr:hypothetical protein [Moraxellaceae bacterium]